VVQQGPPPSQPGRLPASGRPPGGWSDGDHADDDEEYPPWAVPGAGPRSVDRRQRERRRPRGRPGPAAEEAEAGRYARPPRHADGAEPAGPRGRRGRDGHGRKAAARARRARRATYIWGGAFVAVLLIVAGVGYAYFHQPSPPPAADSLVTTFRPGEFTTVPNACSAVTAATLDQYLPGKRHMVVPKSLYGGAQSLCDWSVDAKPRYRVLQVTVRAYPPSGLASGNGSATFAAKDAYQQASQLKAHPLKASRLPKATMRQVPGLGNSAFAALQVPSAGGAATNLLTVVVRERNALITVVSQGPAQPRGGYAAVSPLRLRGAAVAAARDILAGMH
jgi:hypothetical protein